MCHAPRRTASLLTFCLALLFCCTVLTLAPPSAARADRRRTPWCSSRPGQEAGWSPGPGATRMDRQRPSAP